MSGAAVVWWRSLVPVHVCPPARHRTCPGRTIGGPTDDSRMRHLAVSVA